MVKNESKKTGDLETVWKERVRRWKSSGMTAQEFAAREGVSANRLHVWSGRLQRSGWALKRAVQLEPTPALLPVVLREAMPLRGEEAGLEFEFANGEVLRFAAGANPEHVARIVRAIRAVERAVEEDES
jgi:transposase